MLFSALGAGFNVARRTPYLNFMARQLRPGGREEPAVVSWLLVPTGTQCPEC